ncbi:hypothetical protein JCM11251_001934 [Rhodosporidiobolus azoricus]
MEESVELETLEELHLLLNRNPGKLVVLLPSAISFGPLPQSQDFPVLVAYVCLKRRTRHKDDLRRAFRFMHLPKFFFIRDGLVLRGLDASEVKKVPSALEKIQREHDAGTPWYPVPREAPKFTGWGPGLYTFECEGCGPAYCTCTSGIVGFLLFAFLTAAILAHPR